MNKMSQYYESKSNNSNNVKIYNIISSAILSTYDNMKGIVNVVEYIYKTSKVNNPEFIEGVNEYIDKYNEFLENPEFVIKIMDELKNYIDNYLYNEIFSKIRDEEVIANILNYVEKTLRFDMSPALDILNKSYYN